MLHEAQRTSAPSALSVSISTAVWMVMCSEPQMRARRHEPGHLGLGDGDFLAAPVGETDVLDDIVGNRLGNSSGGFRCSVHDDPCMGWESGAREPARRSAVAIAGPAASCNEDIKISLCPQTCPRAELSRRPGVDPARPAAIRQERPMREKTQLNLQLSPQINSQQNPT